MGLLDGRESPRRLLLTGTVGSGKTTTAEAVGLCLREQHVAHAVIDLDEIARLWPAPVDDPFRARLGLSNLAAMSANFVSAGAERIILAGVVEGSSGVAAVAACLGSPLTVCRLRVPIGRVHERLLSRHLPGEARDWHLHRSGELDAIMERDLIPDSVIDIDDEDVQTVARMVLRSVGW